MKLFHGPMKQKSYEKLSVGELLLINNAPVHKASTVQAAIKECGFTKINHPPYNQHMASTDSLSKPEKLFLHGKQYPNDDDLADAMME